ncbi:MAG: FtsH protease activity modulator HflK [Cellvibrionales bacterium]|nr:FtsH protease activity modulator HflK [Cellvibrionales bacterium]
MTATPKPAARSQHGDGRDPWGKRGGDAPPDLDELLRQLRQAFAGLFGGKGKGRGGKGGGKGGSSLPVYLILGLLAAAWLFSSFYVLDEKERGVVMRFGKYHKTIDPGLRFNPYLIDTVEIERVTEERQYTAAGTNSLMLTQDENIVQVPLTVQYNIKDVKSFVLNVNNPIGTLELATDSAIRHVVGSTPLEAVLSEGRSQMADEVEIRLQSYLDNYGTGINVIDVTLQRGEPPAQVNDAFDDVNAAEQDKDRLIDQAEAYRNGVLPQARGQAQRIIEEANAYKGQLIAKAQGEASRFEQLYAEYQRAPEVTRQRLYLDAVQQVMQNSSKVMIDVEGGNNMLYLPLDRLRGGSGPPQLSVEDRQRLAQDVLREVRRLTQNSGNARGR